MRSLAVVVLVLAGCKGSEPARDQGASKPAGARLDPTPSGERVTMLALPVATPVPGKRATLPAAPPRVGDLEVMTKDTQITGLAESGGKGLRWSTTSRAVRALEVLAVDGDTITRARVTYRELTSTTKELDGSTTTAPMPHLGHTYLAEWTGDELAVKREDGSPLSADEETEVRDDIAIDNKPSAADAKLTGPVLESGVSVALPLDAMAAEMGAGFTLTTAEARLIDVHGDVAAIELHLVGSVTRDETPMSLESRDVSEISISTGQALSVVGVSALTGTTDGIAMVNRVEGTQRYTVTRK